MTPRARDVSFAAWVVVGVPVLIALAIEFGPPVIGWLLTAPSALFSWMTFIGGVIAGLALAVLLVLLAGWAVKRRFEVTS